MQQHKQPVNWTFLQKACDLLVAPTKQFQSCRHQPYCCNAFSPLDAMSLYCTTGKTQAIIKNIFTKNMHKGQCLQL